MPWCPQCDEVFPEGPACPRCSAPLIEGGGFRPEEQSGANALSQIKVPRRLERAFDRLGAPRAPSRQLVAFAVSLVLLTGGFALGRMSALPVDAPVVRAVPGAALGVPLKGYVDFLGRVPGAGAGIEDLSLLRISLQSGTIDSLGRVSSPFQDSPRRREGSRLVGFQESVALLLSGGRGQSMIGVFPDAHAPVFWIDGTDAAWESPDILLVREPSGMVRRWSFEGSATSDPVAGSWTALFQTSEGAVLEGSDDQGRALYASGGDGLRRTLPVPDGARTVAVSTGVKRALLERAGRIELWDGAESAAASLDAFDVSGATFSRDGDRVAVTLRERKPAGGSSQLLLGVLDRSARTVTLRHVTTWPGRQTCAAMPVWDESERWVFLAPGDGSIYAVEVAGGRVTREASVQNVGCGIA